MKVYTSLAPKDGSVSVTWPVAKTAMPGFVSCRSVPAGWRLWIRPRPSWWRGAAH